MGESEHEFHVRRAREELDLAYRADLHSAMAVHFRLSALHMARAGKAAEAMLAETAARVLVAA